MGDLLSEFGDLVFTLVIGYMGAVEFLYVVRHLYHWSCNHEGGDVNDADSLARLQENMRQQLATATATEQAAGKNAMQDGVLYENGFRVDPNQADIDNLKEQLNNKSAKDMKRQELEKELDKQKQIAEKTRKELQEAEAEVARQQREAEENERKIREAEQRREREQKQREEEEKRIAEEKERKLQEEKKQKEEDDKRKAKEEEERKQQAAEEEKRKAEEERQRKEDEENARKLKQAEEEREREQQRREEEAENSRQLLEAERLREQQQRQAEEEEAEREENEKRMLEAERLREQQQRQAEEEEAEREENEKRMLEAERQMEEKQREAEDVLEQEEGMLDIERRLEEQLRDSEGSSEELTDNERQLIASIKQRDIAEQHDEASAQKEAELLKRILQAREQLGEESEEEQNQRLFNLEEDREQKQKRIDENARLFLEAEKEMAAMQEMMEEAVQRRDFGASLESAPQTPVVEEPCVKKIIYPLEDEASSSPPVSHKVKTQLAQSSDDSYSVSTKSLLFPGVSDDASSNEPISSQQSSFSTQPSEEVTTGNESQYLQQERQEPDGEDTNFSQQYSDDYLRSLDGIKSRPLSREDRSGRRIAFKKRRSSGSSNSSRDSRASRDEELKMFSSLEEEEMRNTAESPPLRYSNELKVKGHHRRHKRSPAKDMKSGDESLRSSLERLGEEEAVNPWGDVVPEHYKDTAFWKREKAVSIEEEREMEKPTSSEELNYDTATNLPSASSFEEATQIQNEKALNNLRNQDNKDIGEEDSGNKASKEESARSDNNINLQTSNATEKEASPARSSASPRLRRSPRIEEMNQYEERWKESNEPPRTAPGSTMNTPTITVQTPLDFGPWRDEYGLIKEGLSDFYDFTASVNPSRSRSTSRNPSPANTAPNTPQPRNVSYETNHVQENGSAESTVEVYDDTDQLDKDEFSKDNINKFLDSLQENESSTAVTYKVSDEDVFAEDISAEDNPAENVNAEDMSTEGSPTEDVRGVPVTSVQNNLQYVVDDLSREKGQSLILPMVNIIDDSTARVEELNTTDTDNNDIENTLAENLRSRRNRSNSHSRSRSKSPLPTADNIQRSLETRRNKMIKHNEDVLEKLMESNLMPETLESPASPSDEEDTSKESMTLLVESLRAERSRSRSRSVNCDQRSRSRSKSPLPSPDNIQRSLETRRNKMIKHNDDVYDKLVASHLLPESTEPPATQSEDEDCSKESMTLLVESLRAERSRSRTRSRCRSPIPSTENIELRVDGNSDLFDKFSQQMRTSEIPPIFIAPLVSIEVTEPPNEEEEYSRESMDSLVQSLRVARSRSRSKSPMRLPTSENLSKSLETRRSKLIEINDGIREELEERARTPEPPQLTVEYVYEFVETSEETKESSSRTRMSRSRTPSRSPPHPSKSPEATDGTPFSRNPSRSVSPSQDDSNFHVMLNLEGSQNKTLSKNSEEYESTLADRLKQLDEEALDKLKNASEEIELRTLSPVIIGGDETKEQEENDLLTDLPMAERRKMLRISPTTPDYDRTISEEMKDVERIKQERLVGGFKRSTYVGESMDFVGPEYESMRREAARFQRSRSPTPSFSETPVEPGQMTAAEKRHIQDLVLAELTVSSEMRNTGAIPKAAGTISTDSDASLELEEMRRRNAEFRRSASKSRSPLGKAELAELAELAAIEAESARRELKDKVLDEISNINFQDFSRQLNPNFLDNDRRASDSALIRKPEILIQLQDNDDIDVDPEEYHHFRRFSLAQEQPIEEYPSDDYIFIQQVEVRTRSGSRTWTREDFYSQDINDFLLKGEESAENVSQEIIDVEARQEEQEEQIITTADEVEEDSTKSKDTSPEAAGTEDVDEAEDDIDEYVEDNEPYELDDDEESNGSEDDRRTVIEVDDEIDEDISDFNERGPADESHHEQSECEEAEREMDRYADREASDWAQVMDVGEIFPTEQAEEEALMVNSEGAVGGASSSPYDSDSFAIDQIYDEAIRNRKQSGILREFDSILNEMSSSSIENSIKDMDEQYALWSKTQKKSKNIKFSSSFIESERRDTEMRYLGDANVSARQSTRLRSRFGYNPVLQSSTMPDDIEVDMNYKPKREYNWRKNFRLSDDDVSSIANKDHLADNEENSEENQNDGPQVEWDLDERSNDMTEETYDVRKYSLDGESITLFSQSPEKTPATDEPATVYKALEEIVEENATEDMLEEKVEKPKKKKTKKKTRKGSKGSVEALSRDDDNDNDDYERPAYSRRSSSIHMETDSPKRISRSRRSSRSSLTNEDSFGMYSPRSSVGFADPITDIMEEYSDVKETARPKKIKKRKKVKEIMADVTESPREEMTQVAESEVLQEFEGAASTVITPDSAADNVLATLSPQESICVTPGSLESEISLNSNQTTNSSSSATSAISVTTPVDTFDILKDANFYPLF